MALYNHSGEFVSSGGTGLNLSRFFKSIYLNEPLDKALNRFVNRSIFYRRRFILYLSAWPGAYHSQDDKQHSIYRYYSHTELFLDRFF